MYRISKRTSGYLLRFSGTVDYNEMQLWFNESQKFLKNEVRKHFGVIIETMGLEELPQDSLPILVSGIKLYKDSGMLRLSIIFENDINYKQFKSLALKAGISLTVRYIDTSYITNAVDVAIDWVKDAKDPEL